MSDTPETPQSGESVSASALVSDTVENAPGVREEIVSELQKPIPDMPGQSTMPFAEGNSNGQYVNTAGNASVSPERFDPTIHEVDATGNPRLTVDGKFRRKRGRRSGSSVSSGGSNPATGGISGATHNPANVRATAVFFCGIMFGGLEATLGKQWEPAREERESIETATAVYCEANNIGDLPPGIMLAVAVGAYAIPRMFHPETKERLTMLGISLGFVKPKPVPPPEKPLDIPPLEPTANPGNNGVRMSSFRSG